MTTIRGPIGDSSAPGSMPGGLSAILSRGAHPSGLVAPGVIRRALPELPAAIGPIPADGLRAR